jgi:hypothetical protein
MADVEKPRNIAQVLYAVNEQGRLVYARRLSIAEFGR